MALHIDIFSQIAYYRLKLFIYSNFRQMLTIRLFRYGNKNNPTFRVCVSAKQKDTHGRYLESVGHYIPKSNPKVIQIDAERVNYWISQGAQPSPTVHNLLVSQGIIKSPKIKSFTVTKEVVKDVPTAPATASAQTVAQA